MVVSNRFRRGTSILLLFLFIVWWIIRCTAVTLGWLKGQRRSIYTIDTVVVVVVVVVVGLIVIGVVVAEWRQVVW